MLKNNIVSSLFIYIYYLIIAIIIGLGLYLRGKSYFLAAPTWFDELNLANNLFFKSTIALWGQLDGGTADPPLFLILLKLMSKVFGHGVLSLRFIPFCFSLASIFVFYFLLKKVFLNKFVIIATLLLFSINGMLIYYAQDTKPYSSDLFFCILLLLLYEKIDIKNWKQAIWVAFLFFIVPFISFPSIIVISSILISKIFENRDKKTAILYYILGILGVLIAAGILYFLNIGNHGYMLGFFEPMVFNFSPSNFIQMISDFLKYLNIYSLFTLILFFIGMILFLFRKKSIGYVMILIFMFALLATYLKKYPFSGRTMIYIVPIFLISIFNITDYIYEKLQNKIIGNIVSIIMIIAIFFSVNNIFDTYPHGSHSPNPQERITQKEIITNFLDRYNEKDKLIITRFYVQYILYYNLDYNKKINYEDFISDATVDDIINIIRNDESINYWIFGVKDNDCAFDGKELEQGLKEKGIPYENYGLYGEYLVYMPLNK